MRLDFPLATNEVRFSVLYLDTWFDGTLDQCQQKRISPLAWVLAHPSRIIPILGTGVLDEMRSSAQAEKLTLARQQWFTIWEASRGERLP